MSDLAKGSPVHRDRLAEDAGKLFLKVPPPRDDDGSTGIHFRKRGMSPNN